MACEEVKGIKKVKHIKKLIIPEFKCSLKYSHLLHLIDSERVNRYLNNIRQYAEQPAHLNTDYSKNIYLVYGKICRVIYNIFPKPLTVSLYHAKVAESISVPT